MLLLERQTDRHEQPGMGKIRLNQRTAQATPHCLIKNKIYIVVLPPSPQPPQHGLFCVHFGERHECQEEWLCDCPSDGLTLSIKEVPQLGPDKETPSERQGLGLPCLWLPPLGVHSNKPAFVYLDLGQLLSESEVFK